MKNKREPSSVRSFLQIFLLITLGLILTAILFALAFISHTVQGSTESLVLGSTLHTETVFLASPTSFLPLPTLVPTRTPAATLTTTVTPTITESPTPLLPTATEAANSQLPDQVQIEGITGQAQYFTLDCEARSAVDWAAFFGVTIDEYQFLSELPQSDNPDVGFVGSYKGFQGQIPPDSYGVHADPIAALLRDYDLPAKAVHGMSFSELQSELAAGRPVIAWVIFLVRDGTPIEYTARDGSTAIVAYYEHTVILTGYDSDRVTILDGSFVYHRTIEQFLSSWSVLGNMAIIFAE